MKKEYFRPNIILVERQDFVIMSTEVYGTDNGLKWNFGNGGVDGGNAV